VCGPMVPEPQTTAFEDERHARLRALNQSVGAADGVPGHGPVSVACQLSCQPWCGLARPAHQRTLPGGRTFTARPPRVTTMQTDAHNKGRDERRALLEQRRAAVARQLRRLTIELADIDRQLDEIEQSER
jgi:hypothetical protein